MKIMNPLKRPPLRGLVLALAVTALSSLVAQAVPYASQVTKSGNTVTFILNQAAAGITVLRDNANPVTPTPGPSTPGLQTFDMTGFTTYSIMVTGSTAKAWTQFIPDGVDRNFWFPNALAINKNPASTNFGKVYAWNNNLATPGATGAGRTAPEGLYVLQADGAAFSGPHDGGLGSYWTADGTDYSRPYKMCVNPDDNRIYVSCFYDDLAFGFNDDMNVATQLIDASNKGGSGTTAQYVESVYATGSQAAGNLMLYAVDSNYNDTARRGVRAYTVGSDTRVPVNNKGVQMIGPVSTAQYYINDIDRDSSGNWYTATYRANANQAPNARKWDGSVPWPITSSAWDANQKNIYVRCVAVNDAEGTVGAGQYSSTGAGNVYFFDIKTGLYTETVDIGNVCRDLAFDAAGNMVTADNGTEYVRFWSPGGYTLATTSFDGTSNSFQFMDLFPAATVVATQPSTLEGGDPGVFTITRTGDLSSSLTVNFTLTGTAANGVDYTNLATSVVFPANVTTAELYVRALGDTEAEPTKTAILTLIADPSYHVKTPSAATVSIVDTNTQVISASISPSMYERVSSDYANVTLQRNLGDTNVSFYFSDIGMLSFGGTAVLNVDYVINTNLFYSLYLYPGDRTATIANLISPIDNALLDGTRTVTVSIPSGADLNGQAYIGATNVGTCNIIDDENPAETVLWSDDFNTTDSATNYRVQFDSENSVQDYSADFALDYQANYGVPPAPHSTADTLGLRVNVNKLDATAKGAAGVNLYPTNHSFSGNYALRFDMYLLEGSASATEYAIFGINHDAAHTNWFRNDVNGYTNSTYDGVWGVVEADASGTDDYLLFTGPSVKNTGSIWGPTYRARAGATAFKQVFKSPPFAAGGSGGGSPANLPYSATPTWADVEVAQVGNLVTLRINHTVVLQYNNTVAAMAGTIMLGYNDAYDSIGDSLGVIYDNVRVVQIFPPTIVSQPTSAITPTGGSTNFTVVASGSTTGFTNYQWRLNGVAIPGATQATLALNNVQLADYGAYTVVVSDGVYSVTSDVANLLVLPPGMALGSGTGLQAGYWTAHASTAPYTGSPTLTRLDPNVNFDWVAGSPDPLIAANTFTARWVGQVQALSSGTDTYTFTTMTDDGVRLWVNGQLVIDSWVAQSGTARYGTIALTGTNKYDLIMEYFEGTGNALARLYWSNATTVGYSPVPQSQLYPADAVVPTMSLTAPANGSSYMAPATINLAATVTAANKNLIQYVSFYSGPTLIGSVTNAPYDYAWTGVPGGSYNLTAAVVYNTNWMAFSAVTNTVTVTATTPVTSMGVTPGPGSDYSINYSGGSGARFVLVRGTNVNDAVSTWARVDTNTSPSGSFVISVGTAPKSFYRIISE